MPTRPIYINGRFLTQATTGVQRYAREVVRALDAELADRGGRDAVVVLTPGRGQVDELPLRVIETRRAGRLTGHAWEQGELPLHARGGALLSLANVGPLAHPRHVVTIHDASVFALPDTYSRAFGAWYRFLLPRLGRAARLVLTVSEFSRRELAARAGLPAERTVVLPLSGEHIADAPADPGVLERSGIRDGRFLLAVGSRSPHKNLGGLLRALPLVTAAGFRLVIAGGVNARVFGDAGTSLPADVVHEAGYVTDGELRALYERADGFVYPSLYEGFGLPPLEAMWCGCPVLTSRRASLPEVCGDAALYCDPEDPSDIARGIDRLMADECLRADLRARGRARAAAFAWRRTASAMLDLLTEVRDR
jgi:glycosyltransferase involved in cell wall biosynthesis